MKHLCAFLFSLLLVLPAWGRVLSGTVLDTDGVPVIGAGVVVPGNEKNGVSTNLDGNFVIEVPKDAKTLQISALGFKTEIVDLTRDPDFKANNPIVVILEFDSTMLDQVVITGYSQTTVKRITGSVGIINSDKFESKPLASVSSLMQGEIAGVQVQATSGQPGTESRIRIRGTNNLSGNSSPLWVVDGVPLQNDAPSLSSEQLATGGFDNIFVSGVGGINPNDIESITVLKDAAAAAIYGSRAANGVIVVTTKRGQSGRMKVNYSNNFTVSFRPQRSLDLMDSSEKLDWEQTLWDEFSADKFAQYPGDNTIIYPVVGIVGQIRSGSGRFAGWTKEQQDGYIESLRGNSTNWYNLLFRNAFSQNHHLSLSGGGDHSTYYISGGVNDDGGMLRGNDYNRFNLTSNATLTPVDIFRLDIGIDLARQKSVTPESYINPFRYAYFANPYELAFNKDGSYAADETFFTLGYYNGRGVEQVMPDSGFNILRELDNNSSTTTNTSGTARAQAELKILPSLRFVGLASYTYSGNATDRIVEKSTYTAFHDRLGLDDKSKTNLYGNITQNRTTRESYVVRGHFAYNNSFADKHTVSAIAGAEIRGSKSNTIFTKRYNYDPVTGTTSLPPISGPTDEWLKQVERLNGQYFTDNRYASFYASADYYLGKTWVFNASVRADGSSNFGSDRQFNPTWSAGAAWHFSEEEWMKDSDLLSHGTLRAAYGFTGDVNTSAPHYLVMQYTLQEYRWFNGTAYNIGTIPTAPNPELGWEKTGDAKIGLDLGFFDERLTLSSEAYYRLSTDVVTSSQVASSTGYTYVYYNSADMMNSGIEFTLGGKILKTRDWNLSASVNFAYNYNKVIKYSPASRMITAKDRYVEGYPVGAILSGVCTGIDPETGLYSYELRSDAQIKSSTDLGKADNYRQYLGTTIAPFTGGFNLTAGWKHLRLSVSGVYSFGNKVYDKIESPASYYNALHHGYRTETVQSQYSDLYSNHLNVRRDRTSRWTESNTAGVLYPRIYDYYGTAYNFSMTNPMDYNIIDSIYLKDVSYLRIKTILLTWDARKYLSFNLSMNNFITLTSYDGFDPEVPGATYPTTRSVSLGMTLTL